MGKQNLTTGFQNVDSSEHQFLMKFLEDVGNWPPVVKGFESQVRLLDGSFDCLRTAGLGLNYFI